MHITITNLSYIYNPKTPFERKVLDNVNLTIMSGQWLAVVGQTGSGKSTLVQHINGLVTPSSGTLQIGGITIRSKGKIPPLYKDIGLVFQYPEHQLFEDTVFEDIAYGPKNLGWPEGLVSQRVHKAIELVGLDSSFLSRSPFELSGGEKRRVAIAGVLAMNPKVLILDEPTAGLDPLGKDTILELILKWQKEENRTIIHITHQMDDVARYADEVVVLSEGKIKWQERPLELFSRDIQELEELSLALPKQIHLIRSLNKGLVQALPITSVKKEDILEQIISHFEKGDMQK